MEYNFNTQGKKYLEAIASLPKELRSTFTKMVDSYAFHCLQQHGKAFVAFSILADMVRDGWVLKD